jgi:hypothetical protein
MSSRALRRAQREQEERELEQKLAQQEQEEEEDEESDDQVAPPQTAKPSLFAMLGDDGGDDDNDSDDDDTDDQPEPVPAKKADSPPPKPSKKSKKKKKKAKAKSETATPDKTSTPKSTNSGLDEIDQALLALNITASGKKSSEDYTAPTISDEKQQLYSVLSVDSQHLHAANEMKKLFGRAALQAADDEPRQRQQRGRGQQGGIAAAIAGRNGPGNRGLASLSLRRNIFIQGKEEWPRATSGGLGMEIVERREDGSVEYRFVHNTLYQEVQRQFQVCVASMDPERMIQLLHFNRKPSITHLNVIISRY